MEDDVSVAWALFRLSLSGSSSCEDTRLRIHAQFSFSSLMGLPILMPVFTASLTLVFVPWPLC